MWPGTAMSEMQDLPQCAKLTSVLKLTIVFEIYHSLLD